MPPHVAIVVDSVGGYGRGLLRGISAYVRDHGSWTIHLQAGGVGEPPAWLKRWKGQGILARIQNRQFARLVLGTGLPAVDLCGAVPKLPLPLVYTDDATIAQLAAEHFCERGFQHFAFCGFAGAYYSEARARLFTQALARAQHSCLVYQLPSALRRAATWEYEQQGLVYETDLKRWLKSLPRPIGLMACNDIRAQQVLNACREIGVRVPDELAVLGVDDDQLLCELSNPPLSSIAHDTARIGYEAAALLDCLMAERRAPIKNLRFAPKGVVTRQSTDVLAVEDREMAAVMRFIRERACQGINVKTLLAAFPYSRSILERRFVKVFGLSPKAEILRLQIQCVQTMLAHTHHSLDVIAAQAGFKYAAYLNAVFRKTTGQTPGQFRALVQGQWAPT
jgi:LacI family transcriptional regulator